MVAWTTNSDLLIRPARGGTLIATSMLAAACSDGAIDTPTTSDLSTDLPAITAIASRFATATQAPTMAPTQAITTTSTSAPPTMVASAGASFDGWVAASDGTLEGEAGTFDLDTETWQLAW